MKPFIKHHSYEPIHQARWTLKFPDKFNIPEFSVKKTSKLKYYKTKDEVKWERFTITISDLIAISATKNIIENLVQIPTINIEKLDPIGKCVERITIHSNEMFIDFGRFDYFSDKFNRIKITLQPTKVIVST